jgi:hypothetical protein
MSWKPRDELRAPLSSRGGRAKSLRRRWSRRRSQWRRVMRSTVRLAAAQNASRLSSAQNIHDASVNADVVRKIAPRPSSLTIARVLPPLAAARRELRRVLRVLGDLQPSSAPRSSCAACTLPRSLTNAHHPSRFSTLSSRISGAPMWPPRRAALHDREPGARRRREAGAGVETGRHRDAGRRQGRGPPCRPLAAQAVPALAHHVADVAEHEQVAGQHAGRARHVLGLAGDEAARKACDTARRVAASRSAISFFDQAGGTVTRARRQIDEAARELDVSGRQRLLDLARATTASKLLPSASSDSRTGSSAAAMVRAAAMPAGS